MVISNRGGYGRPPADWLAHEFESSGALTIEDIATETGEPEAKVRSIIKKYSRFLQPEHRVFPDGKSRVHARPSRLKQLYTLLSAEFELKKELRAAGDGGESNARSAFSHFLKAARKAGYEGRPSLEDRLPRAPETISDYCAEIKAALGLPA